MKYVDPDGRLASETTKEKFRNIVYGYYDSGNHTYITVPVGDDDAYARAFDVYTCPANQALIGNFLSAGFDGIAYVDESGSVVSLFNTEESIIQEYNRISPYKCVTNEMLIVGTMRFFADNGNVLSMICYATGQIELGLIIDGVTLACDVTLDFYDYGKSNRTNKDRQKLITSVATSFLNTYISSQIAGTAVKGMNLLGQKEIESKIVNSLGVLVGTEFDICIDNVLNNLE